MSHIVTIRTEVRDVAAVQAACQRLQWPAAMERRVKLFSGEVTQGDCAKMGYLRRLSGEPSGVD